MREIIKLPLTLFLITVIAGMILGTANYLTKEPIKRQHELALKNARDELFEESEFDEVDVSFDEYDNIKFVYEAHKNGQLQGYIVTLTKSGYGGEILMNVGVTKEGIITGVIVGTNSETPGLGAKAAEEEFAGQFKGKTSVRVVKGNASQDDEISAITAATITSQAIVDGANQAIDVSSQMMGGK